MFIALWILNGLLAFAFVVAGLMKLARTREALATSGMAWATDYSDPDPRVVRVGGCVVERADAPDLGK